MRVKILIINILINICLNNFFIFANAQNNIVQPASEVVRTVVGLVLLVDFSDSEAIIKKSDTENYLNSPNPIDDQGTESVFSYFKRISNGKFLFSNKVYGYIRADKNFSFYDKETDFTNKSKYSWVIAKEALDKYFSDPNSPGLKDITLTPTGGIRSLIIVPVGYGKNALWAHAAISSSPLSVTFPDRKVRRQNYSISPITTKEQFLRTLSHESTHLVLGWKDVYDYNFDSKGIGDWTSDMNPYHRNVFSQWGKIIWLNDNKRFPNGTLVTLQPNVLNCFGFANPKDYNEMYLIEFVKKDKLHKIPGDGLLIWHIDKKGQNSYQEMTKEKHYAISLEQADGLFELEKNINSGNPEDAFTSGSFGVNTIPDSKWWDGSDSGFSIKDIKNYGNSMSFILSKNPSNIIPVPNTSAEDVQKQIDTKVQIEIEKNNKTEVAPTVEKTLPSPIPTKASTNINNSNSTPSSNKESSKSNSFLIYLLITAIFGLIIYFIIKRRNRKYS